MSIVTLLNGKTFYAKGGGSILDNALSSGVILEYSCRVGRCGACKAKTLSGATKINITEQALTQKELKENYVLTCCRTAIDDISLDIEDLGDFADIKIKTLPCRIDSIEKLAVDVLRVFLRLPPKNSFKYLAGQHVNVIGHGGVRRSYSIANAPLNDGKIELHIRRVNDGVMSNYWFNDAKCNDLLRLEGPLGTFSFRDSVASNLVFLATGTGIAPIKAILEGLSAASNKILNKSIYVYWGGRIASDIYLEPILFDNLKAKFTPILSRPEFGWGGRKGYVQQALLDDGIDLADVDVYACGSDEMVHSALARLVTMGFNKRKYYADAFVSSN